MHEGVVCAANMPTHVDFAAGLCYFAIGYAIRVRYIAQYCRTYVRVGAYAELYPQLCCEIDRRAQWTTMP